MIELCKINKLIVLREVKFGIFLGEAPEAEEAVLLPKKEVPEGASVGDSLEVFVYLDSEDRRIATLRRPLISLGGTAVLEVVQTTPIGAFLNWGLEKDLFLPFKEQISPVSTDEPEGKIKAGDRIPVLLYIDKSGRPAATMRIYNFLEAGGDYVKDSGVEGTVVDINPEIGVFVAVDDKYFGMISIREVHSSIKLGDKVYGRVSSVRSDGKYMISLTQKAHIQMDEDAEYLYKELKDAGGELPFGDKSGYDEINKRFNMSKNAFKRAIGRLYKEERIVLEKNLIKIREDII